MRTLPLSYYLGNPKANNFNLLRLLAAVAVILGHSFALSLNTQGKIDPFQALLKFTYSGSIAVDVFFLLSGIFVSQSLFFDRSYAAFLVKRFMRIWPGLAICLLVSVSMVILLTPGMRREILASPATYSYVLKNAILDLRWTIPGVFEGRHNDAINGSLWTLPVEVKMYLIVLIFGIFNIIYKRIFLLYFSTLTALLALIFPDMFSPFFNLSDKETLVPVVFFLCGMAVFAYRELVTIRLPHLALLLLLATLAYGTSFEVLTYILIGMATLWFGCSQFIARLPRLPGDYSYGMYIYAYPVQQGVATIWPSAGPYQMFATATLTSVFFAVASWHLVELPAQRFGKSVTRQLKNRAAKGIGDVPPVRPILTSASGVWGGLVAPLLVISIAMAGARMAAYRLDKNPPLALDAEIVAFGPTPITHARPFNQQPNGESAIWVKLNRPADKEFVLVLEGIHLNTVISGDLLTAYAPEKPFNAPGSPHLWVETTQSSRKLRSSSVTFEVR